MHFFQLHGFDQWSEIVINAASGNINFGAKIKTDFFAMQCIIIARLIGNRKKVIQSKCDQAFADATFNSSVT